MISDRTSGAASPVIVGVDGSEAGRNAALWAVDEAVSRGLPLKLVSATKPKHLGTEDYYDDLHRAQAAVADARAAIEATGRDVEVQADVVDGPATAALIELSESAEMICVGTVGIGRYARSILGSTATELAEKAHCPVAVIRPADGDTGQEIDWIVVALDDRPDSSEVVERAMQEAELRHAPVLALGDADPQNWKKRHPDVHVYPITDDADVAHFLKKHDERVQLAVIGSTETGDLAQIVGPHGHPVFHHAHSSALVVRS
ncbi:MAG: universal stress protein [Actinomycetota bacterium]|nr:universal stress protein [Actinomycetota bacterium]